MSIEHEAHQVEERDQHDQADATEHEIDHRRLDSTLVRRAQWGDTRALDTVVQSLVPYLGRICGAIALDDGDDALQEALVAVVRNLGSLREPAALRGWARTIAVREALRAARTGRGGGRSAERPGDHTSGIDHTTQGTVAVDPAVLAATVPVLDDAITAIDVRSVLADLAPEHRAVLVLRHVDGMGEREMAELLHVAQGTVKSRLARARAAFKARWSA